jgi:SAM-dependent methyltransferase
MTTHHIYEVIATLGGSTLDRETACDTLGIPANNAFQETWHPGEEPHLITATRFNRTIGERLESYDGDFAHKDRGLRYHELALGFNTNEIPYGGRLLVIGPGVTRKFEREVYEKRPDIQTVSIDPMLRYGVRERLREGVRSGADRRSHGQDATEPAVSFPFELTEGEPYYRPGALSGALADKNGIQQGLPLAKGVADNVIALFSVPMHLDAGEVQFFLNELGRIMRPGAIARIYPFGRDDLPILEEPSFRDITKDLEITEITQLRPHIDVPPGDFAASSRRVVFTRV